MLTPEQVAVRAARELRQGESVHLDEGWPRLLVRHLPPGVELIEPSEPSHEVDVAVLAASEVSNAGEFCGDSRARRAKRVIVLLPHNAEDGSPRVRKACREAVTGTAQRVITDLAVFDVAPEGLVMREVAPGVSALDVQLKSGTPLLGADDLTVIDV